MKLLGSRTLMGFLITAALITLGYIGVFEWLGWR